MGSKDDNIRYFLQGSGAALLWDPVQNAVVAQALDGVFVTKKAPIANKLKGLGYREVTKAELTELGFRPPKEADRTNWTIRDSRKYTMF